MEIWVEGMVRNQRRMAVQTGVGMADDLLQRGWLVAERSS
jgi:hypothetical protein